MLSPSIIFTCCTCFATFIDVPVSSPSEAIDVLEEIMRSWREAEKNVALLEIDYAISEKSAITRTTESWKANFQMSRSRDGKVLACLEVWKPTPQGREINYRAVLRERTVHVLFPKDKKAFVLNLKSYEVHDFVLDHCVEATLLFVEKQRTSRQCHLAVVKEDHWYCYLDLVPRQSKMKKRFQRARVVVMKEDSGSVPKHAPRQMWFKTPDENQWLIDVQRWRVNHKANVDSKRFELPTWKGWTVTIWNHRPNWNNLFP